MLTEEQRAIARQQLNEIELRIDWPELVRRAMADPPQPDELIVGLQEWRFAFERAEDGPPLLPDFPEAVRDFFVTIRHMANHRGRPGKGEEHLAAVAFEWKATIYRVLYRRNLELAALSKKYGFKYNGRYLTRESPSDAVIADLAKPGLGSERINQIIRSRRKNSK